MIKKAIKTKNKALCLSIAYGYAWSGWAAKISPDEIRVLKGLLKSREQNVKQHAIHALSRFPISMRAEAIQLVLNVKTTDEMLADSLCGIFDDEHGIPFRNLKDDDLQTVLAKLTKIQKLDDHLYHIHKFLAHCVTRIPEAVIGLLLKRIDISAKKSVSRGDKFQPLPYLGFRYGLKGVSSTQNYREVLRRIRDRALDAKPLQGFWLSKLFVQVSCGFSAASLEVLEEWISSYDVKKVESVGLLLGEAPPEFVFSHSEFVKKLLDKAHALSRDCCDGVSSRLFCSAISGTRSGTAGQPMPRDVEDQKKARELSDRFPVGSPAQIFYSSLREHAQNSIRRTLIEDEEISE